MAEGTRRMDANGDDKPAWELAVRQRVYGPTSLLAVSCVSITVLYLAYDMYLPALPTLTDSFGVSDATINLTLFLYMIFQAIGQILGGSLSDKLGRKPVLLAGMGIFTTVSLVCMLATSVWTLVAARAFQGLGAGAAISSMTAIVSDSYEKESFDRAMAILQSLPIIGPVAAPFVGSLLLTAISWKAIFGLIAALGAVCVIALIVLTETLPKSRRIDAGIGRSIVNMGKVCLEPGFAAMVLAVSMSAVPIFGYMAVCSYVYIEDFGLGYTEYSIFYGAMAALSVLSPFIYLSLSRRAKQLSITWICIVATMLSGALALATGSLSALAITLSFVPVFLAEGMFRSQGFIVLLENRDEMRGAASSAANFFYSIFSSLGTVLATLPWLSYELGLGAISLGCGLIAMALWVYLLRSGKAPERYRRES